MFKQLLHIQDFRARDILEMVPDKVFEHCYEGRVKQVYLNSKRLTIFKDQNSCAICGLEGRTMSLYRNTMGGGYLFQLIGKENRIRVRFELDHIRPLSKGGSSKRINLQTTCRLCNRIKGNSAMTNSQILELRQLKLQSVGATQ